MKFIEISKPNDLKLECKVFGSGEPMLFLHGGGTDFHFYESFLEYIGQKFEIHTFAYPGYGNSTSMEKYSLDSLLEVISNFVDKAGINDFTVMGHSLGGGLATAYSANNPKVKGLVLLAPAIYPYKNTLQHLISSLIQQGIKEEESLREVVKAGKLHTSQITVIPELFQYFKSTSVEDKIAGVEVPVLGMVGDQDIVIPAEEQIKALNLFKTKKIIRFNQLGHDFFFKKQKEILEVISGSNQL